MASTLQINPAQRINQTSGQTEYYTPPAILEAARAVLGVIELDPASSFAANKQVRAVSYYTADCDGLKQPWQAKTLWMNHPFSRKGNRLWIAKFVDAYRRGDVQQALCITYASTSEGWFKPLLEFPQCFLYRRTNYLLPDGSIKRGVTKGSVITYLGEKIACFNQHFAPLGAVKVISPLEQHPVAKPPLFTPSR